jgi:hypothetical protein
LNFLNIRIFNQILIVRLINFEFNGRNALQNTASSGGAFFPHQRALQNATSGGEKSVARAPAVCSAPKRRYSAPRYTAPVGDALNDAESFHQIYDRGTPKFQQCRDIKHTRTVQTHEDTNA